MWPPGHLALGYLAYTAIRRVQSGAVPNAPQAVALAVGTQLPDIVDKPLSWTVGLLPTGRSLSHSAFTATLVTMVAVKYADRNDRKRLTSAFVIGYWSHLLGDLYSAVGAGAAQTNWFFLWPVVPQQGYVTSPSLLAYAEEIGWWALLLGGYLGVFAVIVAGVSGRTRTDVWTFSLVVGGVITTSMWVLYVLQFRSPWHLFELVLVQVATAVWIRDGTPGLPIPRQT